MNDPDSPSAEDLYSRQRVCLKAGLSAEGVLSWTWLWREAGYMPRQIRFVSAELAAENRTGDRAALAIVRRLERERVIRIREIREGRQGHIVAEVLDPLEVFDAQAFAVRSPSPQRDFPFAVDVEGSPEDRLAGPGEENSQSSAQSIASLRLVRDVDESPTDRLAGPGEENSQSSAQSIASSNGAPGALADGHSSDEALPELARRLREATGADSFDSLFHRQRIDVSGSTLNVRCDSLFARERLDRHRLDLMRKGVAIDADFQLIISRDIVAADPRAPPSTVDRNSQSSAQSIASFDQEQTTVCLSISVSDRDKQTNEQTGGPSPLGARPPTGQRAALGIPTVASVESQCKSPFGKLENLPPLLREASAFYEACGDETCYPWVAISAAIYVRDGKFSATEMADHWRSYRGTTMVANALKQAAKARRLEWITPVRLAPRLAREFSITWNEQWKKAPAESKQRRKATRWV